jgi:hypothetical protein
VYRAAIGACLATCLLVFGCGRKGSLKPPELVAPRTITDLGAKSHSDGIVLSWSRPTAHADGSPLRSLGSFVLERAQAVGASDFQLVATIELTDRDRFRQVKAFRYLDRDPAVGQTYRYRVFAYTDDGYGSQPSNVASATREKPEEAAP